MKKIELLAPAASFVGMKAVINAGADAVYMGGYKFGARAYADNFDKEEMIEAIRYAHLHNVKVHLTVNTVLKENEINNELYDYILPFYEAGLDAVIVQDIGALRFFDEYFPGLEKHMSTQTTITSSQCISIINAYKVNRIVLARELSLEEIEEIKRNTNIEVETFIHGALCYSYSGQCLLSSMIGERSGNRGRCAQPCRKQYKLFRNDELIGEEKYLLSPKDMCGLKNVHNLINIGVDSLKIEGRMKSPEYGATIVNIYRKYIDLYYELGFKKYVEYLNTHEYEINYDIIMMQDVYSRGGFTSGYFDKHNGSDMMSVSLPSHQGVMVGKVIDINERKCSILLQNDVNAQDVLLIRDKKNVQPEASYEFTLKEAYKKGKILTTNYLRGTRLRKGQVVYRVKNNSLLNNIKSEYIAKDKRVQLDFKFIIKKEKECVIEAKIYNKSFKYKFNKPMIADNRPITKENIIKQFSKLNNTPFVVGNISIDMDNDIFVPIKVLNDMRRSVVNNLIYDYNSTFSVNRVDKVVDNKEVIVKKNNDNILNNKASKISIMVSNQEQLKVIIDYVNNKKNYNVDCVYLEMDAFKIDILKKCIKMLAATNINVGIALPRIIRSNDFNFIIKEYYEILEMREIIRYLVRNIEGVHISRSFIEKKKNLGIDEQCIIIGDNNLYVANNMAKKAWFNQGIEVVGVSLELSEDEIKDLDRENCQLVIYGKPVVMVSAGCVKKTNNVCNHKDEILTIKDRYGEKYKVRNVCNYCYNLIYYSKAINLINDVKEKNICSDYRIDFTDEEGSEITNVLDNIINDDDLFKGHFIKKVL